ncbi:MAG: CRISPR-associated endonuclease Cas1 [Helicobacteraceae bacterium]|jgi:CRISPR-associated protein Cas1|nr:CRISPR-associated endonuclease Cas1 [Helicobacteraceae bacterium]
MNIVYVDKPEASIDICNGTLKIDDRKIPLLLIDTVVFNTNANLAIKTILKLTNEGISIALCRSEQYAIIHGAKAKNSELKAAQYEALNNALFIAKYLVTEKIIRHSNSLRQYAIDLKAQRAIKDADLAESIGALRGIEGAFARQYFSEYFTLIDRGLHNGARVKRPPTDPANAMLSYLYSLFYNLLSIRLLTNGFELGIAYLHTPFRTHNALASDLMELFRHTINEKVVALFADKILNKEDFAKKEGVYLRSDARKRLYPIIKDFWLSLESQIAIEIARLRKIICDTNRERSF